MYETHTHRCVHTHTHTECTCVSVCFVCAKRFPELKAFQRPGGPARRQDATRCQISAHKSPSFPALSLWLLLPLPLSTPPSPLSPASEVVCVCVLANLLYHLKPARAIFQRLKRRRREERDGGSRNTDYEKASSISAFKQPPPLLPDPFPPFTAESCSYTSACV